jgi:hypothetical protein
MTFPDVIKSIPGLTHYYPLATDTKDTIGTQNGTPSGVTFSGGKAVFNGKASINLSLACNGAVKDKDALSGYSIKPQNTTTPLMLGTRGDNTGFLVGKIRRVAIYNRVLTATELTKIYNARDDVEGTTPSTPTTPTESPYHAADTTDVVDKHNALVAALEEKGVV